MSPLVTCLCLTRARREWLSSAIEHFRNQTYSPRELLIVADGPEDVEGVAFNDSRATCVYSGRGLTIGAKRNFGCGLAGGQILAHWDDDDYSAPGRLADQVGRLLKSGKAVTGYSTMRFTDGARSWQYIPAAPRVTALGTSLVYHRAWWLAHRFDEEFQVGEDCAFAARAADCDELVTANAREFLVASIHPGNTSKRSLTGSCWRPL